MKLKGNVSVTDLLADLNNIEAVGIKLIKNMNEYKASEVQENLLDLDSLLDVFVHKYMEN